MQNGDVFTLRQNQSFEGTVYLNVSHWQVSNIRSTDPGPPPIGVETAAFLLEAADVFTNLNDNLWSAVSCLRCRWDSTTAQLIYPDGRSRQYTYTPALPIEGNEDDQPLPLQDAATLIKRTPFGTRWGIGRVFHSGLPESSQDGGILNPVFVGALNAYGSAFDVPFTVTVGPVSFTANPVLFGEQPVPLLPRITLVTDCELSSNVIKTQRRRRPGKGI
jgi:hypothetical protein